MRSAAASGPAVAPVHVLVVEDHRIFADVLAARLGAESEIASVRAATSLGEARANILRSAPDIVLLDQNLNGEDGLDLISDLRKGPSRATILVLSASRDPEKIVRALAAGADGWINKTARFDLLMAALRRTRAGEVFLEPAAIRPVVERLLARREEADEKTFATELSPRQRDVLRCLVSGLSRGETAERLHISVNTVRTHVQAMLALADVHSTLALTALARQAGFGGIDDADDVSGPGPGSSG